MIVLASVILLPFDFAAHAQGLKKIRWGQTSIGASQWIPWIAKDAKFYAKKNDWAHSCRSCRLGG